MPFTRLSHNATRWLGCVLAGLALCASVAAATASADDTPLRIGSKRFTESYILAELLAQQAAPHARTAPQVRQGLGNTAIVYEALRAGQIDVYPEYAGTISQETSCGEIISPARQCARKSPCAQPREKLKKGESAQGLALLNREPGYGVILITAP